MSILSLGTLGVAALSVSGGGSHSAADCDDELWSAVSSNGDALLGSTFEEAVRSCPIKVDALIMQRVGRPFLLLCSKVVRPWAPVQQLDDQIRDAWFRRNDSLRMAQGFVSVKAMAASFVAAWRHNGRLLVEAMSVSTPETERARVAMRANRADIRRAFDECRQILDTAACLDPVDACCWLQMRAVVDDMEAVVNFLSDGAVLLGEADIAPDLGLESVNGDAADRFGAVSMDDDTYGQSAHEEFIVSGHRAPSVGLFQYRRMGGRVF
jgi:hypothetical protein